MKTIRHRPSLKNKSTSFWDQKLVCGKGGTLRERFAGASGNTRRTWDLGELLLFAVLRICGFANKSTNLRLASFSPATT